MIMSQKIRNQSKSRNYLNYFCISVILTKNLDPTLVKTDERNTIVNWITMTRKSGEHLRMTNGNTGSIYVY